MENVPPPRSHARWAVAVAFVALVLTACAGSDDDEPMTTVPTAPSTTTTTIDVSTVPDEITVEYVQAVMDELDRVTGDMIRAFVTAGGPDREFVGYLAALFDRDAREDMEAQLGRYAAQDLEPLEASPGNPTTDVHRILDVSPDCIVLEVRRSFERVLKEPPPEESLGGFVQLSAKRPDQDPRKLNSTAWVIVADVVAQDAEIPEDVCR